jgi:Rrf2 family nitric oxide-sensitive transcriptional repressor
MHLTYFTDYTLRVLMYTCKSSDALICNGEMGNYHNIFKNHLLKVVHKLGTLSYLKIRRVRAGGLALGKYPHEINIGTFVAQFETQYAFIQELRNYSLADVINHPKLIG